MIILEIALGYALGRLLTHLASIAQTVVIKMLLTHHAGFRALVRQSQAEDQELKRKLTPVPDWSKWRN